ncbi:YlxR family protein [Virgibacillus sp. 179-BFC.A HS]|uniref:YlxR family protein n=1 Tax=Tigheibacillus jepli TaxID=3035914 RepID=A0ABU5CI04_9BACI|nr:YlxR family protein [Virgibacillus sp. 179-BFC.A HS]MDY0405845.1 YlxR family protein [Virgibacillus sp. 179-BFC.A HS]
MKKRKIPMRKCVVTNEMMPKKELIRVVRNKDGEVFVDLTGKKNGRGAYVSKNADVIRKAKKTDVLRRHLEAEIPESVYDELLALTGSNEQ